MLGSPLRRIGPYELGPLIGEGGMGQVYRAHDSRLGRDVAIKILPDAFVSDPARVARFQREAQLLASLSHQNIGAIFGFEEAAGVGALVLEIVEGPTLAERLAGLRPHGAGLPLDEALPIARQIVDALEAAHEKGIVHRDLKPSNIKLKADGSVKVLDFGLAKMHEPAGAGSVARGLSQSPTILTASIPGTIVGTAAYMAPEQARGLDADRTADIWAFGCVLYEMLSGQRLFDGGTVTDVLADVLKSEPNWRALPADTPHALRLLLRRCLQKDRRQRLRDIADARFLLEDASTASPLDVHAAPARLPRRERRTWQLISAIATVAAMAAIAWSLRPMAAPSEIRLEVTTPSNTNPTSLAISPDGRTIAFVATSDGPVRLWVRSLSAVSARVLPGTDGASSPFWSPDSRSLGFFADSKLKRIDLDGGAPRVLTTVLNGYGGSWNSEGTIIFIPSAAPAPVLRIAATGGQTAPVASTKQRPQQFSQNTPQFLPDGKHFVYYVAGNPDVRGIYAAELDGSNAVHLVDSDGGATYSGSGYLLFARQGTLFAQRFDPDRLLVSGAPIVIAEQVATGGSLGTFAAVSASAAGTIVYRTGTSAGNRQFVWVDRSGTQLETLGEPSADDVLNPSMSADGRTIAVNRTVSGNMDVWLFESRGVFRRFTFDPAVDNFPLWSSDGHDIVFSSTRTGGPHNLYRKPATGGGEEELLLETAEVKAASDWSLDGRTLLFRSSNPKTGYDIWALPLDTRKPFPVVQTAFAERDAQFSPDGHWIAYQSDESGRFEIYVQPFPGPGGKFQISTNGGAQVRWRRDGKEIFFIGLDDRLMAAPVRLDNVGQFVEAGAPVPLFTTHIGGALQAFNRQQYVVSRDGQRFLMSTFKEEASTSPISVILNWKPKP
jgi:serine/threonine protein kinase